MGVATKNLMWEADGNNVMAGHRLVATCSTAAIAKMVALEHNAHEALLAELTVHGIDGTDSGSFADALENLALDLEIAFPMKGWEVWLRSKAESIRKAIALAEKTP